VKCFNGAERSIVHKIARQGDIIMDVVAFRLSLV
jgi:hypothetical protein